MKEESPEHHALSPKRTSSRREFLRGKSAVDAIEDLAEGLARQRASESIPPSAEQIAKAKRETLLQHFSRPAMACEFQIFLPYDESPPLAEAAIAGLDLISQLEDQLSVYRPLSEVSRLNGGAHLGPIPVETRLFELLAQAQALSEATQGAFDITSGPLVKAWGFYRREGRMPADEELSQALVKTGYRHLRLDPQSESIHFLREGIEINLGAIGKGHALDRCGELLHQQGIHDFLLHGGQSSVLAQGRRGDAQAGWKISLSHLEREGEVLHELELQNQAVGTSGTARQHFFHRGKRYGHLLDPRTGRPVDHLLSATCIAPAAADADALATAFFVLGEEAVRTYCEAHPEISALLIAPDSRIVAIGAVPFASRVE